MATLTIDEKTKKVLDVFSGDDYGERLSNLVKEGIRSKVRECNELISEYETKYKREFDEFEERWSSGEIEEKHSHEVETDYLEWEALEMEKSTWLDLLKEEEELDRET